MSEQLTEFGRDIVSVSHNDVKLDGFIKRILQNKPVLAKIFKETISECKDMSCEQIEECIEGEIIVDVIGVNPGTSNQPKIIGQTQEDFVPYEGKITYDLRMSLRVPNGTPVGVKLLVDVEAQKEDTPGYDISERAIFYCSRMLSAQLTTEFSNSSSDSYKYKNIKKVYSIWICTEAAQCRANTIERYFIQRNVWPKAPDKVMPPRYDLLEAVIVNISKKHDTEGSESEMINVLTALFNNALSVEEKVNAMSKYGLKATEELKKEVAGMTSYAARLISESIDKGVARERADAIERMLRSDKTPEQIAEFCGYDLEEVVQVQEQMLIAQQ